MMVSRGRTLCCKESIMEGHLTKKMHLSQEMILRIQIPQIIGFVTVDYSLYTKVPRTNLYSFLFWLVHSTSMCYLCKRNCSFFIYICKFI